MSCFRAAINKMCLWAAATVVALGIINGVHFGKICTWFPSALNKKLNCDAELLRKACWDFMVIYVTLHLHLDTPYDLFKVIEVGSFWLHSWTASIHFGLKTCGNQISPQTSWVRMKNCTRCPKKPSTSPFLCQKLCKAKVDFVIKSLWDPVKFLALRKGMWVCVQLCVLIVFLFCKSYHLLQPSLISYLSIENWFLTKNLL